MAIAAQIERAIQQASCPEKVPVLQRYFKTGKGQYGEGDVFAGVSVPAQRQIAKGFHKEAAATDIQKLLQSPVHEHRLTALLLLVLQFQKAKKEKNKEELVSLYLANLEGVNNWDLVDSSAPYILGAYLFNKPKTLLYEFATSGHLWKQRIAIVATYYFIKKEQYEDTLAIAKLLLHHPHDLIHKATGWMLRKVGNRNKETAVEFLAMHYQTMPRTALRYAIEKLEPQLRLQFLKGLV